MNKQKHKKQKISNEYRQLQTKLFFRTVLILLIAALLPFGFYSIFLQGHFAEFVVRLMDNLIYNDYEYSLIIYDVYIRRNAEVFFGATSALIFLVALWMYIHSFTRYFNEINRGIDALIEEGAEEIALPPELNATEKKLNHIRHTLEKRKLAAELAEKRKNDLVMYLAHDLKTPLSSVIGYLTLLRDEQQISEELREKYLSITLDKAERLEDLINEFFEITRFNLSDIILEYGKINLTRMLEQLVYEFKPMLAEKELKCEISAPPDIMLLCDADKLQRVLDNLLRNAVNYSYPGTTIGVDAWISESSDSVTVLVANEGNTIPQEKLDRIFEQFFRLDTARSSASGGAGLGLAIAKEIVELHNGNITAYSVDGKTCFEVTLPLS